jgi:hypothetical protein
MLKPLLSVILGNFQYDSHVSKTRISLGLLPHVNRVEISLPGKVDIAAVPGDDASLEMLSDGEMTRVLTGTLAAKQSRFHETRLLLVDAAHELAQARPAATYTQQHTGDIIQSLANDIGITSEQIDARLPLASYVAHQNATATEHIARLTALSGCIALISAEGRLNVISRPTGQPDSALLYGREFIHYQVTEKGSPRDQLILAGNGPAGNPSEPGALRHSVKLLPASAPSPDTDNRLIPQPLLKTPSAAVSAAQAINTARAATTFELQADCFLLPQLLPGQVIQVQELPDEIPEGPWLLTSVSHQLQGMDSGKTRIKAELADLNSFGLDSLVGAALGTVGGLL